MLRQSRYWAVAGVAVVALIAPSHEAAPAENRSVLAPNSPQVQQLQRTPRSGEPGNLGPVRPTVAVELTWQECEKLKCTVIEDATCPWIGGVVGTARKRCVCQGGGNQCIDEAK